MTDTQWLGEICKDIQEEINFLIQLRKKYLKELIKLRKYGQESTKESNNTSSNNDTDRSMRNSNSN